MRSTDQKKPRIWTLFTLYKILGINLINILLAHTSVKVPTKTRSSHRRCSVKKGFLRSFAKFTGKHLRQSLFFNKVAVLRPASERLHLLKENSVIMTMKRKISTRNRMFGREIWDKLPEWISKFSKLRERFISKIAQNKHVIIG